MGLDVGVVTIKYLDKPEGPVSEFLLHLANDAYLGCDDEEYEASDTYDDDELYTWGGGWGGNTLVEVSRPYLNWKVNRWVNGQSIGPDARDTVQHWIDGLPWENDMIMLHLGG